MIDARYRKPIAALGRSVTPALLQSTRAMFAEQSLRPQPQFCSVERDIAYGDNDRHRLDIFRPLSQAARRPVLVFVHGGGFIGGDKGAADAPFYNNIGAWAARSGFIGVTMTYRLAPTAPWPAGAEDLAAAVAWLRRNVADRGGTDDAIIVMGQSAGAVHVADYVADPRYRAGEDIAGAIMFSGIYDLTRLTHSPMEQAYYGSDPARFADQSPLRGLIASPVPCLYTVAQFDPDGFQQQAAHLVDAHIDAHQVLPRLLYLTGHNHLSPALAIGGPGDRIGPEIGEFIETVCEHAAGGAGPDDDEIPSALHSALSPWDPDTSP